MSWQDGSLLPHLASITQVHAFSIALSVLAIEPNMFLVTAGIWPRDGKLTSFLWSLGSSFYSFWKQGVEQILAVKQEIIFYYCHLHPHIHTHTHTKNPNKTKQQTNMDIGRDISVFLIISQWLEVNGNLSSQLLTKLSLMRIAFKGNTIPLHSKIFPDQSKFQLRVSSLHSERLFKKMTANFTEHYRFFYLNARTSSHYLYG